MKHRVDIIDTENFTYGYSVIEGAPEPVEKICYVNKLVASGSGTVIKSSSEYHVKGDAEIKEEHVKAGKEKASHLFKVIESYLLEHHDAYN